MFEAVYDNTIDWRELFFEEMKKGYTMVYWASDGCYGFKGVYNGGTFVFYNSPDDIDDEFMRQDAEANGERIVDCLAREEAR